MKFLKLNLTKMTKYLKYIFFISLILLMLVGCKSGKLPRPSSEFYVNDFANALSLATKENIVYYSNEVYEDTKKIKDIGGTQIVFATFLLDENLSSGEIDITALYRKWGIGKNDMGIFTVLFFERDDDGLLTLSESYIEVGYRMEQYLTAGKMGRILDETVNNADFEFDYDLAVAKLLFEYLIIVTEDIYPDFYEPFTYDLDEFVIERDNSLGIDYSYGDIPMSFFYYLFSPYSSIIEKILLGLFFTFVVGLGGTGFFIKRSRGGGGSSGGMRVGRR